MPTKPQEVRGSTCKLHSAQEAFSITFFGHQPQEARFREYEVGYHGMGATHNGNGRSYGGGFSLSYHLVDKKFCGPLGCPEPEAQLEKNRSAGISPFLRIEGPEMGILLGLFYSPWLVIPVPRLALRLGPSDGLYFAIEVFNGRTSLTEGILKIGAGGARMPGLNKRSIGAFSKKWFLEMPLRQLQKILPPG